jgi:hypothetical protein
MAFPIIANPAELVRMLDGGLLIKTALGLIYRLLRTTCAHSVPIDIVAVGKAGNAPDIRYDAARVGAVGYAHQIGKYEVTAGQYTAFLNAVANGQILANARCSTADRQRIRVGHQRNPRTPRQASRNSGEAR